MFILGAEFPISLLPLNLFSFLLFSLQYLSKFVALSYHCSILLREHFTSINFLLITLFIPLLNSSINDLPSYSLSLTALLNSYTNFSIVLLSCFTFFNSATFIISSSPPLNSFFKSDKNSPTIAQLKLLLSRSSIIFSFYTFTDHSCTYDNTHCICSSTTASLILVLIYSLYAIKNPETFSAFPLNVCSLATFTFDPVLGWKISTATTSPTIPSVASNAWSCACIVVSYSCCCQIIYS